jgi:hypothetical protein
MMVTHYDLRAKTEERFRQLKRSWYIAAFPSPHTSLVESHVCFTLFTYSLLQLYLRRNDLRQHLSALEERGLLVRVKRPINKNTELHPLVRWQFRSHMPESERKGFLKALANYIRGTNTESGRLRDSGELQRLIGLLRDHVTRQSSEEGTSETEAAKAEEGLRVFEAVLNHILENDEKFNINHLTHASSYLERISGFIKWLWKPGRRVPEEQPDSFSHRKLSNGFGSTSKVVSETLPYTTGSMVAAAFYALKHKTITASLTSGFHHAGWAFGGGFVRLMV